MMDPLTGPEKTDGVKKSLTVTARLYSRKGKDLKITKTNLQKFLIDQ